MYLLFTLHLSTSRFFVVDLLKVSSIHFYELWSNRTVGMWFLSHRKNVNEAWEKEVNVGYHFQNQFHMWNTFSLKTVDGTANCNRNSIYILYCIKEDMKNWSRNWSVCTVVILFHNSMILRTCKLMGSCTDSSWREMGNCSAEMCEKILWS